jgi:acyl dehydratase
MSTEEVLEELTGTSPAVGTFETAQEWIGRTGSTNYSDMPVNPSRIQFYASMLEDGNPSYWDEEWADDQWGGIISPAGMSLSWQLPPLWSPEEEADDGDDDVPVSVATIPLPEGKDSIINTETETIVHEPIRVGTWLNWEKEIISVTEEKDTMLGPGHFVTTKTYIRDETGTLLAEDVNSMLRFDESEAGTLFETDSDEPFAEGRRLLDVDREAPDDRYASLHADDAAAEEGELVNSFDFPVTYRKVIHDVASTRDFYPVHHDPEFAKQRGNETIFLNTMALQGLVDRAAIEWAGPEWRVVKRNITMAGSALAGDVLTVRSNVVDVDRTDERIELEVEIMKDERDICPSTVTIQRGT